MTATPTPPEGAAPQPPAPKRSKAATASLFLAIGTLLAAAILGGFLIIVGDQANIAGRAWLTLLLVALFAGAVVLDAQVGDGPNKWYLAASTITNVVIVAIGLIKLWNGPLQGDDTAAADVWFVQLLRLLAVIVLLRLALLVTQLYSHYFVVRAKYTITKIMSIITIVLVWLTVLVLAVPAAFPEPAWPDWWWRIAGATSLVAVVSIVIPLIVRAFEPKDPKPAAAAAPYGYAPQQQYAPQPQQYAPQYAQQYPAQPVPQPAQPAPAGYEQAPAAPAVQQPPVTPSAPPAAAEPEGQADGGVPPVPLPPR